MGSQEGKVFMNRTDKEFNRILTEFINDMQSASTDEYMEIKLTLLSRKSQYKKVNDYLRTLFAYIDSHRPLLISMKEGVTA